MEVSLTAKAAAALRRTTARGGEEFAIRIVAANAYDPEKFHVALSFWPAEPGDQRLEIDGLPFVVDPDTAAVLERVDIDYAPGNNYFVSWHRRNAP